MNPILWLHIQLNGSWRGTLGVVGLYVALVVFSSYASYRVADPTGTGSVTATWLGIVTTSQVVFLVLIAPNSIKRAVQRDFQTGMFESHRLTPMSGLRIVSGYLLGPPVNLYALYASSLFLGGYFAGWVGVAVGVPAAMAAWWGAQLCLLVIAFFVAALVLLGALGSAGKVNLAGMIVAAFVFGSMGLVVFVPGIALLGGLMTSELLFKFFSGRTGVSFDPRVTLVSMATQLAFGVTFIIAACRKIRHPDRSMFSIPLSLVLCGISAAVLIGGVATAGSLGGVFGHSFGTPSMQIFGSTVAFIGVATFVLLAGATERYRIDRAAALGVTVRATERLATAAIPLILTLATAGVIRTMCDTVGSGHGDMAGWRTAVTHPAAMLAVLLALACGFWTDFCWIYLAAARGKSVGRAIIYSALLLKVLPLIMDGLVMWAEISTAGFGRDPTFTQHAIFSGVSPLGTLLLLALGAPPPWIGLACQVLIGGAFTVLAGRVRRNLAPTRATPATA